MAHLDGRQFPVRMDLEHRQIGIRIHSYYGCLEFTLIVQRHADRGCLFDNVGIGQHETACAIDDDAGAKTGSLFPAFKFGRKKIPEELI